MYHKFSLLILKIDPVQEYESLLYSLVSLVVYVPCPDSDLLKIERFCDVLSNPENQKPGKHCESRLRVYVYIYFIYFDS